MKRKLRDELQPERLALTLIVQQNPQKALLPGSTLQGVLLAHLGETVKLLRQLLHPRLQKLPLPENGRLVTHFLHRLQMPTFLDIAVMKQLRTVLASDFLVSHGTPPTARLPREAQPQKNLNHLREHGDRDSDSSKVKHFKLLRI